MIVMSWNIQWGRGVDGRVDLARVVADARRSADFDVLCLQEVAVNCPGLSASRGEDQVAELAALLPGFQACFAAGSDLPDGRGGRSQFGNLILSRLPVGQVFRHALPWPADPDVPSMPRVALEAVVEAPWGPLRIVTSHLEYYSPIQRLAQVQGLRELHEAAWRHSLRLRPCKGVDQPFRAMPRPASALFCGDFNFAADAPEHGLLADPFESGAPALADAWQALHPGQANAHTVGLNGADWPDHPYCCDFIYLSADLLPRLADFGVNQATAASDHQPVWVVLQP